MTEQQLIDEGFVEGKKSFDYYINEIKEQFDFELVHKAMMATGWVWHFGDDILDRTRMGIPDLDTIKNTAYSLLKEAYESYKHVGSGGFMAGWEHGEMYLTFTLEQASIS